MSSQLPPDPLPRQLGVLGAPIDVLAAGEAAARIGLWAQQRQSRAVCICNVHSVVTATQDATHMQALRSSDMNTPDGAPIAWFMRRLGATAQRRVAGPDLMMDCCARAEASGDAVFFYGSTEETLRLLRERVLARWPRLQIAGAVSPPFRALTADEDAAMVRQINDSGARIVWVGLGCPKQEQWMAQHRGRVQAVMVGVGAAFEFLSGQQARAPRWMRQAGLEWLYRLVKEPRRLWRRYLVTNTVFMLRTARELLNRG